VTTKAAKSHISDDPRTGGGCRQRDLGSHVVTSLQLQYLWDVGSRAWTWRGVWNLYIRQAPSATPRNVVNRRRDIPISGRSDAARRSMVSCFCSGKKASRPRRILGLHFDFERRLSRGDSGSQRREHLPKNFKKSISPFTNTQ